MMHCVSLDERAMTASGYLSPPSRCGGKLFNFAAIESWTRVFRQCLHDGEIAYRPGWRWEDVHHLGEDPGSTRALSAASMPAFCADRAVSLRRARSASTRSRPTRTGVT